LLVVAGLIYWLLPAWKIRRAKLVPISAEDAPEVVACLADLCREAGLSRSPAFVWNPLNPVSSGLAFGRLGRYYVALTGGLVTQFYTDRPAFRAVMLHELAHLRNGDVDKTYFTVAIWRAFVAAALVPFAISWPSVVGLLGKPWSDVLNEGWRLLALAALVYLTRNAVLRVRETYADVRASVWDGPTGALRRVLESLPRPKGGRWRSVLRVHPDPDERRRTLDDTDRLFQMGFWDAFGTGIAATIAFQNFEFLLSLLIRTSQVFLDPLGSALVFAPLAVGVVGLGVWRGTFAALARGKSPRGSGRLGLGLGLGAILGQALSFVAFYFSRSGLALTGLALLVFDVLWNGLLLVGLFLFFRWVAVGASTWLEVAAAGRSPRLAYRLGLVIAGGLLAVWLAVLYYIYNARVGGSIPVFIESTQEIFGVDLSGPKGMVLYILASFGTAVLNPLNFVAFVSLWTYPLAAWFWRGRVASASGSSWAFLDPSSQPLVLPRQAPLRPALALTVGLIGGMVFCVLSFIISLGLDFAGPGTFAVWMLFGQAALAALLQAGVAAVVAAWVKRLGGLHGLFAAFVAGCVMAGGVLAIDWLIVGTEVFLASFSAASDIWFEVSKVINGGALLALPTAWGVSALAGRVRQAAAARGRATPPAAS
jgi:Zn-dependent protease with chaperone function